MFSPFPSKASPDRAMQTWRSARPEQRAKAKNRLRKMIHLTKLQDEFDTGTIIPKPGRPAEEWETVSPKYSDYRGIRKQVNMTKGLIYFIQSKPDVAIYESQRTGKFTPSADPQRFAEKVADVRKAKPSASKIITKSRLTGFPGTGSAHFVASVTDISKHPPHTVHIDSFGKPSSEEDRKLFQTHEMERAYRTAFPGTTLEHSTVVQEKDSQLPFTAPCHINATVNAFRAAQKKPQIPAGNLLLTYRIADHLSKEGERISDKIK